MQNYKNLVVQDNELLSIKSTGGNYTTSELKLLSGLISGVHKKDNDLVDKTMDLKELGFHKEELKLIAMDKTITRIMSKVLLFPNGAKAHWFSYIDKYNGDGILKYRFIKELVPYLIDYKNYTSYELTELLALKGKYSILLFEYLKRDEFQGGISWSWEELKENLQIPKSQTATNIKKILEEAHKEINEKTSVGYNYKNHKMLYGKETGRYQGINFQIFKKRKVIS